MAPSASLDVLVELAERRVGRRLTEAEKQRCRTLVEKDGDGSAETPRLEPKSELEKARRYASKRNQEHLIESE